MVASKDAQEQAFRIFGRPVGEHTHITCEEQPTEAARTSGLFQVVSSTDLGSRYIQTLARLGSSKSIGNLKSDPSS